MGMTLSLLVAYGKAFDFSLNNSFPKFTPFTEKQTWIMWSKIKSTLHTSRVQHFAICAKLTDKLTISIEWPNEVSNIPCSVLRSSIQLSGRIACIHQIVVRECVPPMMVLPIPRFYCILFGYEEWFSQYFSAFGFPMPEFSLF